MIVFVIFGGIMRKQYKISAKYFLNKSLRCYEDNSEQYFAVYIRLIFHRKISKIKSGIGYMTESEFAKFQQGDKTARAWNGGYETDKNGNLKPALERVKAETARELDELTNTILLIEDWTNKEYDLTAARFDSDKAFFLSRANWILAKYGRMASYFKSNFGGNETENAKNQFFRMVVTSDLSLDELNETFKVLNIPFSNIIPDSDISHWIFSNNIETDNKSLILWLITDYQKKYKNNIFARDIIELIKEETQIGIYNYL